MTPGAIRDEHSILQLQRLIGNQAVLRMLRPQEQDIPHDNAGSTADRSEQEAERNGAQGDDMREVASRGIAGPGAPLPHLDAIQRSFGEHDVSGVEAHVGSQAADANQALDALGYTLGNHVAFAAPPDLHTAAHEAAHVVQQRAGVHLRDGVGKVGDSYERQADAVAERVVRGESASDLLVRSTGSATPVVQRQGKELKPEKPPSDLPRRLEFEFHQGLDNKKDWTDYEDWFLSNAVKQSATVVVEGIAYQGYDDAPGYLMQPSLAVLAQNRANTIVNHIQNVLPYHGVAPNLIPALMAKVSIITTVRNRSKLLGRTEGAVVRRQ
jgi:hypothetical protein